MHKASKQEYRSSQEKTQSQLGANEHDQLTIGIPETEGEEEAAVVVDVSAAGVGTLSTSDEEDLLGPPAMGCGARMVSGGTLEPGNEDERNLQFGCTKEMTVAF